MFPRGQAAVQRREVGPIAFTMLWTGRAVTALSVFWMLYWFESAAVAVLAVALWPMWDIGLPRVFRWLLSGVGILAWLGMAWVCIPAGFLGYRIAHGWVYRASAITSVPGVVIEYTGGANGGCDLQLLPGLRYDEYYGPYGLQIFIHDDGAGATKARIVDGYVESLDGSRRVVLHMIREVRWYHESRTFDDGWIPFQTHWKTTGGDAVPIAPARCGLMHDDSLDLESMGDVLFVRFTLQLDVGGRITNHPVVIQVDRTHVGSSGLTVHS